MTKLDVHIIDTPSLGDRSYLVADGQLALVVDPQRDIDRVLDLAAELGVRIAVVAETHGHNDYVSGGLELAAVTGAEYRLPAGMGAEYPHTPVGDGDRFDVGDLRVTVLHTPGHTHHHVAYAVSSGDGPVEVVLTGGSMLFGSTGRTDLVGPEHTDELTRAQYRSVRRLAADLPDTTVVLPTHGFGSFCSATPTAGDASTVAEQRATNPALTQDEQSFVEELLAGLDAFPAYYPHMGPANRHGPAPVDLTPPAIVDPVELRRRLEAGEWVVDLRDRTAFAAGHLAGSRSFELSTNFVTYLGWLLPWGAPLTLLGETAEQLADARRELVRIGVDHLDGAAVGPVDQLADGRQLRSYPVADFADLAARLDQAAGSGEAVHVLDARRHDERRQGHVAGSQHIPIHELTARLDEVPTGEVWVYCGSGYRAAIACSLLDTDDRALVHVNEDYPAAAKAGLETQPATAS
jgi:glyoxylase-like metal-dependent hydrolase (beta-lactamase superfamily II)/rhodanese-related sulfurtransferase